MHSKLEHFSWCLLVAVKMARREGRVSTLSSEHAFILKWLENAQKFKLFDKELAKDILALIKEGKSGGPKANLLAHAEYVWTAETKQVAVQNDLFRTTYLIDILKGAGWSHYMLSEKEWDDAEYSYAGDDTLWMRKHDVVTAYDSMQNIFRPVELRFRGNAEALTQALTECHLNFQPSAQNDRYYRLYLSASQNQP